MNPVGLNNLLHFKTSRDREGAGLTDFLPNRYRHPLDPQTAPRGFFDRVSHALLAGFVLGVWALPVLAIQPDQWVHTTEADFAEGQTDQTVVTNLGDIKLAARADEIGDAAGDAGIIYDMQPTPDGDLYLAAGPEGALLRYRNKEIEPILALPDEQVFALDLASDGRLLVAVSAATSRIAVLEGDRLRTMATLEGTRYVWDMIVDGDQLFLATGTDGKLLRVDMTQQDEAGQPVITQWFDAAQSNLLCLGRDSRGQIYTGTDGDGLIYRLTDQDDRPDQPTQVFVVYDAPEPEIGALLVTPDGTVYAGTADADQARPGRLEEAADTEAGRPETTQPGQAQPQPGEMPRVPPQPEPMDGQPATNPDTTNTSHTPQSMSPQAGQQLPNSNHQPPADNPASQNSPHLPGAHPDPVSLQGSATPSESQRHPEPTAEQRDRLRAVIRQRLEAARQSGTLQSSVMTGRKSRGLLTAGKPAQSSTPAATSAPEGNAIYRITPQGFVTEVFRESVMILKLLTDPSDPQKLLVATGNEGQLFRVDPDAEETTILADLEPQQVPAMSVGRDNRVLLGTANPATLVALGAGFAQEGTYTSPVLDAKQISLWGKMTITGNTPAGTTVGVQTRSGNVEDPDQAAWSIWSNTQVLEHDPSVPPVAPHQASVDSPPARFLQYRLTLTGTAQDTAVVDRVVMAYVVPNLKPQISSIQASYPQPNDTNASPQPAATLSVEWEASDPNNDPLVYTLEYQPAGTTKWLPLIEDIEETSFEWHTDQAPDGHYLVRVTASDQRGNPPDMARTAVRRTDPVLIDNTPPSFNGLEHRVEERTLRIAATVEDALATIRTISYSVDSGDRWQPVLPDDLIYDSTREAFTVTITDLKPGPHVVALRATDAQHNARYASVMVEIP